MRITHWFKTATSFFRRWLSNVLTFLFAFLLVFSCIFLLASRGLMVKKVKSQLPAVISYLNDQGLDIAYDNIEFSPIVLFPLITMKNPQIYSLNPNNYWKIQLDSLKTYINTHQSQRIKFVFSPHGELVYDQIAHNLTNKKTLLEILYQDDQFDSLNFTTSNLNIKDLMNIKRLLMKQAIIFPQPTKCTMEIKLVSGL